MKLFKYRWKIGQKEITGLYQAEDEAALKAHVASVGGQALEILQTSDVLPPKKQEEELVRPLEQGEPEFYEPPLPKATTLLHSARAEEETHWLLKIWGWTHIILSILGALLTILFGFGALMVNADPLFEGSGVSPFVGIALVIGLGIGGSVLNFFIGAGILTYAVVAARILLGLACFSLVMNLILLFEGAWLIAGLGIVLAGAVIWILVRKRE